MSGIALQRGEPQAKRKAILYMVVCAAMWSIAGIFIKLVPWNPLVIAGFRSLIAAGVFVTYMKRAGCRFTLSKDAVIGGILLAGVFLAFVSANKFTTAANAIVLQFTAPVFILIFSFLFLHQKFRKGDIAVVLVTLSGISLFFFDQLSPGNLAGNCMGIVAGLLLAGMYIVTGTTDEESRMSGILIGHLLTALVGVPLAFFVPTPISTQAVFSILALGIIQLGIPYVLYGLAVKHCPPLACSLIGAIEPLLNPVWVVLFDGEAPGMFALIGGIVVIISISVWCMYSDRADQREQLEKEIKEHEIDG